MIRLAAVQCWLWAFFLGLAQVSAGQPAPPANPKQRLDAYGDGLPTGATARLGTTRWRVGGWVYALDFSPDGQLLASGSTDNTVRVWHAASGKEVLRLGKHDPWVTSAAFSPDGTMLASSGADGVICLWNPASGKEILRFMAHDGPVAQVGFSPKGKILASASGIISGGDATLAIWDADTGKLRHRLKHGGQVTSLAFDGEGRFIASGCADGIVRLWDVAKGQERRRFKGFGAGVGATRVAFSPDGKTIAASGDHREHTTIIWDAITGQELKRLPNHEPRAFTPDGKYLAFVKSNRPFSQCVIVLWDVKELRAGSVSDAFRQLAPKVNDGIVGLTFSRDGKTLAAGTSSSIHLWNWESAKEVTPLDGHLGGVISVAFAPDGKNIVTGGFDGTVRLWNAGTGKHLRKLADCPSGVPWLAFTAKGKHLVHIGTALRICDMQTGKPLRAGSVNDGARIVGLTADGQLFVTESPRGVVQLWNASSGKESANLSKERCEFLAVSNDGKTLVTGSRDESDPNISIWDVPAKKIVRTIVLDENQRQSLDRRHIAVAPDGKTLALATDRRTVVLWDAVTQKELHRLAELEHEVFCLAFSPDGKLVASGNWDNTIRVYEVGSGKERHHFTGHQGHVNGLVFSAAGATLASASSDSTVLLWDLSGGRR
jgi:WD40 repeat protein